MNPYRKTPEVTKLFAISARSEELRIALDQELGNVKAADGALADLGKLPSTEAEFRHRAELRCDLANALQGIADVVDNLSYEDEDEADEYAEEEEDEEDEEEIPEDYQDFVAGLRNASARIAEAWQQSNAKPEPIQPGDVVRLKSGSMHMTVASIEDGIAECLKEEHLGLPFSSGPAITKTKQPVAALERVK